VCLHLFDNCAAPWRLWLPCIAAESVAVGPKPGQLALLDRYNRLWEAKQGLNGWVLSELPAAYLGPGRPLGYHFDMEGNLIVCNSLQVSNGCLDAHRRGWVCARQLILQCG
jgi:hypothetical protein